MVYLGLESTEYLGWESTEYLGWVSTEYLAWTSTEYLEVMWIARIRIRYYHFTDGKPPRYGSLLLLVGIVNADGVQD